MTLPDPLHPAVVHLPLALAFLLPLIAAAIWLGQSRLRWPENLGLLVVGLQLLLTLSSFAVLKTGEIEDELIGDRLPHAALHEHEEAAEVFAWATLGALALSLLPLLLEQRRLRILLSSAALVAMIVVAGLAVKTGKAGGELVYDHDAPGLRLEARGLDRPATVWPDGGDSDDAEDDEVD